LNKWLDVPQVLVVTLVLLALPELLVVILVNKATEAILLKEELLDNLVLLAAIPLPDNPVLPVATHLPDNPAATHHNKDTANKATMVNPALLALLALLVLLVATHLSKDILVNRATEVIHPNKVVILPLVEHPPPEAIPLKDHQTLPLSNTIAKFHQVKLLNSKSTSKRLTPTEAVPSLPTSFKD